MESSMQLNPNMNYILPIINLPTCPTNRLLRSRGRQAAGCPMVPTNLRLFVCLTAGLYLVRSFPALIRIHTRVSETRNREPAWVAASVSERETCRCKQTNRQTGKYGSRLFL
jgi:hypothetical protein